MYSWKRHPTHPQMLMDWKPGGGSSGRVYSSGRVQLEMWLAGPGLGPGRGSQAENRSRKCSVDPGNKARAWSKQPKAELKIAILASFFLSNSSTSHSYMKEREVRQYPCRHRMRQQLETESKDFLSQEKLPQAASGAAAGGSQSPKVGASHQQTACLGGWTGSIPTQGDLGLQPPAKAYCKRMFLSCCEGSQGRPDVTMGPKYLPGDGDSFNMELLVCWEEDVTGQSYWALK